MKKVLKIFMIILMTSTVITSIITVNPKSVITVEAKVKKPGKVKFGKWKHVRTPAGLDGESYKLTWKKASGAKGYQVKVYTRIRGEKKYDCYTESTKKCQMKVEFSDDLDRLKIKVRAYKTVKGKKVYGSWVTSSVKKL